MSTRTFQSTKAAIGYAHAVHTRSASAATRRESVEPGPPLDPWVAASVYACFTRAGIDPHDEDDPRLGALLRWATHTDGAGDGGCGLIDSIAAVGRELVNAGIVVLPEPPPIVGRRAGTLDGRPWRSSTTGEPGPAEDAVLLTPDPAAAWRADLADWDARIAAGETPVEIDEDMARRWGCSPRTARRRRRLVGYAAKRGRHRAKLRAKVRA